MPEVSTPPPAVPQPPVVTQPFDPKTVLNTLGPWHPKQTHRIVVPSSGVTIQLTTAGLITGCGLQQIQGLSNIRLDNVENYRKVLAHIKATRDTTKDQNTYSNYNGFVYIGTLGHSYWNTSHEALLNLGFTQIAEYPNTHKGHDINRDKQRLYIINLNDIDFNTQNNEAVKK